MKLIVDTGPLVALLDRRDPLHQWAVKTFEGLSPPFLTCEAVLTEASHFLNDSSALRAAWLERELVVDFDSEKHRDRVCALIDTYVRAPGQGEHPFRSKPNADSGTCRTPIPGEGEHPFRARRTARSDV